MRIANSICLLVPLLVNKYARLIYASEVIEGLEWVGLNETEYNMWLNPVDQCMLTNNNGLDTMAISLQDFKGSVCRNVSHGQRFLKCSVGMGVGHIMVTRHEYSMLRINVLLVFLIYCIFLALLASFWWSLILR